ncbi:MAG: efflux RND transporter periplasmic adaptor subunit [Deltaproteobacteria bacterium]|nr:efflux RND transporter periplasmic adaptor subunit [Deltaproteobacteria bacterium]
MKRRGIIGILLLGLILIGTTACGSGGGETVTQPSRGDINVTSDGNLSLPNQRELTFGTTGKIAEIYVAEGDRVTQGQELAKLDTTSLGRAVTTAENSVSTAALAVEAAELAIKTAEIDVKVAEDAAKDTIRAAEIDLKQANDNLSKITYPYTYSTFFFDIPEALADIGDARREVTESLELLEVGLSSSQYWKIKSLLKRTQDKLVEATELMARGQGEDVFEAQILPISDLWTLRTAQLAVEKAQSALNKAKDNAVSSKDKAIVALEKAKNGIAKALANLNTAKHNLSAAEDELEKTVIVAPFDGIIATVDAKPGDMISAANYATRTIFKLVDTSRMELTARVDELDVVKVKTGQKVMISVDAMPETKLEGRVTFISPVAREPGIVLFEDDDEEKEYEVKIYFDIPGNSPIRAGMSATAEIIVE